MPITTPTCACTFPYTVFQKSFSHSIPEIQPQFYQNATRNPHLPAPKVLKVSMHKRLRLRQTWCTCRCIFSPNILERFNHLGRVCHISQLKVDTNFPLLNYHEGGFGQSRLQIKSHLCYGNTAKYHQLSNKHIEIKYVFQHPMFHLPKTPPFYFALAKSASTAKTSPL